MADLTNYSAMALGRVINPVPIRQTSCTHPVKHGQRSNAVFKQFGTVLGEGGEAAIKAHGQDSPRTRISLGYLVQFGFIDAQWLLDKDMFATPQGSNHQRGVEVMSCAYKNRMDGWIIQNLIGVSAAIIKPEAPRRPLCRNAGRVG